MTDLKQIQAVELDILKTTIDLLNKHNIKAFLVYGTCIGAVRHNGFIPWDDDVDIALPREDYIRAREILVDELPSEYCYCDYELENEYPYNFAKVRKKNTAFVHAGDSHLNIHQGIYIDIFPLDFVSDDENIFRNQMKKARKLRRKIDLSCMSYKKYDKLRPIWQFPLIIYGHLFINKINTQQKLDKIIQAHNQSQGSIYICNFLTPYYERERMRFDWYGNGQKIRFENELFLIPQDSQSYLKHLYGDYMKLPPESERTSHHDVVYFSLTEEYQK